MAVVLPKPYPRDLLSALRYLKCPGGDGHRKKDSQQSACPGCRSSALSNPAARIAEAKTVRE